MTTFRWFDGSLGFYDFPYLPEYTITSWSATQMAFRAPSGSEQIYAPYRIVFHVTGGETWYDPTQGRNLYTAGQITGISYYNDDDRLIAEVTGLAVDAAVASSYLAFSQNDTGNTNFWYMIHLAHADGALYVGSDATGRDSFPLYPGQPLFDLGDDITTSIGNDTVQAGGDSDYITDAGGQDIYDGQAGAMDIVSYHSWRNFAATPQTGITADLAAGTIVGPDGLVDQVIGIEAVRGTRYADVLRGDALANTFIGGAGADTIDGRGGFDEVFYAWDGGGGISVNLETGIIRDGFGSRDQVISIESVVGSNMADRFVDRKGAQRFDGGYGDDVMIIGQGNDTLTGGWGADKFKFNGLNFGTDRITDFEDGGDILHFSGAQQFSDLVITESGNNVVIALGTSKVILQGAAGITLDEADFLFG